MDINHRPIFKTDQTVEELSKQEGVEVKYVATTELLNLGHHPIDVFYRATPHPKFGNHYFGLYFDYMFDSVMICDASVIEDMKFAMIQDENDVWHYSQYTHNFVQIKDNFIDGGRAYVRSGGPFVWWNVVDGEFVKEVIDTA